MLCEYECYLIGGPWISENPNCPTHGRQRDYIDANYRQAKLDILIRCWYREISADDALDELEEL